MTACPATASEPALTVNFCWAVAPAATLPGAVPDDTTDQPSGSSRSKATPVLALVPVFLKVAVTSVSVPRNTRPGTETLAWAAMASGSLPPTALVSVRTTVVLADEASTPVLTVTVPASASWNQPVVAASSAAASATSVTAVPPTVTEAGSLLVWATTRYGRAWALPS